MLLGFPLGTAEILIILVIALLIFGPSKLPQLGSSVGRMLRGFKKEMKALKDENEDEEGTPSGGSEIDVTPTGKDQAKADL